MPADIKPAATPINLVGLWLQTDKLARFAKPCNCVQDTREAVGARLE